MRYFSSREIYARLSSIYRKKMAEYDQLTIMRWCAEVVTEIVKDPENFYPVYGHVLGKPKNLLVQLPMNMTRIEKVYDASSKSLVQYVHQGSYLSLNSSDSDREIAMDYYAIPTDENGFPYIREGFEKACEAYCTYNLFMEDYMEGKIDANRFQVLDMNKDHELNAAACSWSGVNVNYVKDLMSVMVNQGYKIMLNGKITR